MVVSIYASILSLMIIYLSLLIISYRRKLKAPLGDGNNTELNQRIRAQSNLIEYSPIFLIMLALAEHNGLLELGIHFFGVLFIIGRSLHAYSLIVREKYKNGKLTTDTKLRFRGMQITFLTFGILAVILISQYIFKNFFSYV